MEYSVGEAAEIVGVTVRLLHHYDEIGLASPSGRTSSGHRRYNDADIAHLRQTLTYRALGFSLGEVAAILEDPRANAGTHLRRQHHLLTDRINRLQQMLAAVDRALEATMSESAHRIVPTPAQQRAVLGNVDFPDEWAAEVTEHFGHAPEFAESARRAAEYTAEDWRQIMEDERSICTRLADVMATGAPPESTAAMDLAEEHRNGLRRWFFDCTPELHTAFAVMFENDDRIRASFEGVAPGLSDYLGRAIVANAMRAQGSEGAG